MTIQTSEIPVAEDDLHIDAERNLVHLNAGKFQDLVEYVDHLESALKMSEMDLERDRHQITILLEALKAAYALLRDFASYYGSREANRYYDLRAHLTRELSLQASVDNISARQCERITEAIAEGVAETNGVAEGGMAG